MNNKFKKNMLGIVSVLVIIIAAATVLIPKNNTDNNKKGVDSVSADAKNVTDKEGNMVIPIADITEKASFFTYKELGNEMEVIAVKASDGSIRTAFNTCQVCNNSGKGYYVQEGDVLVCQNCGNQFGMDDVEITKGGCNPVPITEDIKVVSDTSITISKDIFQQAKGLFDTWKN